MVCIVPNSTLIPEIPEKQVVLNSIGVYTIPPSTIIHTTWNVPNSSLIPNYLINTYQIQFLIFILFHQPIFCSFSICSGVRFTLVSVGMYMSSTSRMDFSSFKQLIFRWKYPHVFFQPGTHLLFMSLSLTTCSFNTMSLGGTLSLSRNLFLQPKQLLIFIPARKQRRGGLSVWKTLISANAGLALCCDEASSPCTSCTLCSGSGLCLACFAGTKFPPSVSTRPTLPSLNACW